jgi:hypothetical protein
VTDFLHVISAPLAELLRTVADYLDPGVDFSEPAEVPVDSTPLPVRFQINDRGGFEVAD